LGFDMTTLTQETILATRQWFADNAMACISEVKSGEVKVNDPEKYFALRTVDDKRILH